METSVAIRNQKDFFAGILFTAFGAFFTFFSIQYPMRSAANAGPGYLPFYLGLLLMILGTVIALSALFPKADAEKVDRFDLRSLLLVLGGVVAFGVLLRPAGLILTLFAVIVISGLASHEFSWRDTLLNAAILIALCVTVFVWALKLQFQLWPAFIN
jgi:hypothetical protein